MKVGALTIARLGAVLGLAGSLVATGSALAGETMNGEQARRFVAGKLFAFNCFDGTRGAGRIFDDGSAVGSIQIGGSGPLRQARVPAGTLQVGSETVCASLKGLGFRPCFNLVKHDDYRFRGSLSGMGFAYCEFTRRSGRLQMANATRSRRPVELHRATPRSEVKVETPAVENTASIEPAGLKLRSMD